MNRRSFINKTTIGTLGVLFSSSLISCLGNNFSLETILGASQKDLSIGHFKKEGNDYFTYTILEEADFKYTFKGKRAFIFTEKEKITGFTIQIEGNDKVNDLVKELTQSFGEKGKIFENEFGIEYLWKTKEKHIKLCFTKPYKNLEQNTYYTEYLPESRLIVF